MYNDYLTATQIGGLLGLTARAVNVILVQKGFLSGQPGNYMLTPKGMEYGRMEYTDNGYGGRCARGGQFVVWDKSIVYEVGDPEAHRKFIEDVLKSVGHKEPFDCSED